MRVGFARCSESESGFFPGGMARYEAGRTIRSLREISTGTMGPKSSLRKKKGSDVGGVDEVRWVRQRDQLVHPISFTKREVQTVPKVFVAF